MAIFESGQDIFHVSRSGSNIISKVRCDSSNNSVKKYKTFFISERVKIFWNILPVSVKTFSSVEIPVHVEILILRYVKSFVG